MSDRFFNIAMVFTFVIIGGLFAASAMALVSLREGQRRRIERESAAGRRVAAPARDSGTFLSAIQNGVASAGLPSSAASASTAVTAVRAHPHSRYPVDHDEGDGVIGFIPIRGLYEARHEPPQSVIDAMCATFSWFPARRRSCLS